MPFVVYLLGLTILVLTTSEFMVAGMVPSLATAFGVTVGEVGNLISLYALGMALGGPVLTMLLLALRVPNNQGLLWMLALYVAGGILAATATQYGVIAAARIVMGVASSACFGVSMTICADLVSPQERGRAASFVLGGLMLAPVLGVPVTTLIEQMFGWRTSFWAVVVLSVACTAIVATFVPASQSRGNAGLGDQMRSLRNRRLWAAYTTSGLIIGATFAAFSYFSAIFIQITGFTPEAIPVLLAVYGVANVIGNLVIGRVADRWTMPVLAAGLAVLGTALAVFALHAHSAVVSVGALVAIGLTGVSLNPAMVARVMRAAHPGPLVNAMHSSVITAGLAFGTWTGGVLIDADYGLRAPLWVGAVLALLGLLSLAPAWPVRSAVPSVPR